MSQRTRATLWLLAGLAFSSGALCKDTEGEHSSSFGLDDYFRVRRVTELALSSDGQYVAYVTEQFSLKDNAVKRTVHLQSTDEAHLSRELGSMSDARRMVWVPRSRRLAFLSNRTGTAQVFAYDTESQEISQITFGPGSVEAFRVSPPGTEVAYTIQPDAGDSLFTRMRQDGPAILIDTARTGFMDFVDASRTPIGNWRVSQLWITDLDGHARQLTVPGHTQEFFWSPVGRLLSVVYLPNDAVIAASKPLLRAMYSSLGILDIGGNRFSTLAETIAEREGSQGKMYSGGEWIPGTRQVMVRRIRDANPWQPAWAFPEVAVASVSGAWSEASAHWVELELYPNTDVSEVIPINAARFYVQTRVKGVNTLLMHRGSSSQRADVLGDLAGSSGQFQFSTDFKKAVFVNESMSRPPEIYLWRIGSRPIQLSSLNGDIAAKELPVVAEVAWKSNDGTVISGWLFQPDRKAHGYPRPLLTYVHGGPSYAFPDAFSPVSSMWPYPFEVLALRGIAVFIPQYRGTLSYGKRVARASHTDKEPVEDIVTGIQSLVDSGVAARDRLGICGYSHGGWLGPMVATRTNMFRAGSFAEGWSNDLVLHELMSGATNRETHEQGRGEAPLYSNPQRYLELSPDLHFKNLKMAGLYESGSEALASLMLGMAKAAHYHRVPHEFYVYPKTGHALTSPALQRESTERNLDWFAFWLMDAVDPAPQKQSQYDRWRQMRRKSEEMEME